MDEIKKVKKKGISRPYEILLLNNLSMYDIINTFH